VSLGAIDPDNRNSRCVYTGYCSNKKGTSEHPEEPTDRCCLSALAGLSKYLPFFGADVIIAIVHDLSTFSWVWFWGFHGHVYKEIRETVVIVERVE
jgi:hypothetical protein